MALKHSKPTKSRPDGTWARAPYNFVPLPEQMITAQEPLSHERYHAEGLTGRIVCALETCSPVYVRGMLLDTEFRAQQQKLIERNKGADDETTELNEAEKLQHAPFFATTEEKVEGQFKPVIPGSSLRGMVRTLVEIIGHGRMRWVANQPPFTFRAVAAQRNDPLRDPYQEALGKYGRNVRAGYLVKKGDDWYVQPAIQPNELKLPERGAYLKVKERVLRDIPGYLHFNHPDYRPQVHEVSFDTEVRRGKRGPYAAVDTIGAPDAGHQHRGTLVCSGNMMETHSAGQRSPRKNHALVLAPNQNARQLRIPPQVVKDYLAGLTPFQKEELKDWGGGEQGCLAQGKPVFYVAAADEVVYFGHSPNFRIPAQLYGTNRAATPQDFVPDNLRHPAEPDLADAIFGWVEEQDDKGNVVGPEAQRAGRVFFGDARFEEARDGIWYASEPITPHVLASPKPTTFQHYLVQDAKAGHNPNNKASLAHYGTSPEEAQIRGYKFYWHKGGNPDIGATSEEKEHESQLTRIMPLKPGVRFEFTIHFENLREEELGALLWALSLPGKSDKVYRHKLGMGKPLGMGAVAVQPTLYLSQRTPDTDNEKPSRYEKLFAGDGWYTASAEADLNAYIRHFETFMMEAKQLKSSEETSFGDLFRIETLLTMLEWREGTAEWLEETRYMEIERGEQKVNEYKERPVLPRPLDYDPDARPRDEEPPPTPKKQSRPQARSAPAGPKREAGPPRKRPSATDQTRLPEVGDIFTDDIVRITDRGDVVIRYKGIPTTQLYVFIPAENVGGKQYRVRNKARCEVVEKYQENDKWVLVCKPGPKRGK